MFQPFRSTRVNSISITDRRLENLKQAGDALKISQKNSAIQAEPRGAKFPPRNPTLAEGSDSVRNDRSR